MRRSVVLMTWCAALAVGTVLFHALGSGVLAAPSADPADWGTWLAERDPLVATAALLRLAAVGVCWYLVVVTTIGTLARSLRAVRLLRFADALTVPALRRLLQHTLGVAVATAMVSSASTPGGPTAEWEWAVLAAAGTEDEQERQVEVASTPEEELAPPSMTLRGLPATAIGDPDPTPPGSDTGPSTMTLPWQLVLGQGTEPEGHAASTHVVRSGESLWRIASAQLQLTLDRSPSDAEVVPYWRELIEANRDRLPDRDDPDLILPGQELVLPPVAP